MDDFLGCHFIDPPDEEGERRPLPFFQGVCWAWGGYLDVGDAQHFLDDVAYVLRSLARVVVCSFVVHYLGDCFAFLRLPPHSELLHVDLLEEGSGLGVLDGWEAVLRAGSEEWFCGRLQREFLVGVVLFEQDLFEVVFPRGQGFS